MVLCWAWTEGKFKQLRWYSYFERHYGATTAWRWGSHTDTNLLRMPDQLVFQS